MTILDLVSQKIMIHKGEILNEGLDHINLELVALLALENAVNKENRIVNSIVVASSGEPADFSLLSKQLSAAFNDIWAINKRYHVPELFAGFEEAEQDEKGLEYLLKEKQKQLQQGQEHLNSLLAAGSFSEAVAFKKNFYVNELGGEFVKIIDNWIIQEKKELSESKKEHDQYVRFHMTMMNSIGFIFITILFWLSYSLNKTIGSRLDKLVEHTRLLAKGNFRKKIEISGKDELAGLAVSFNEMTTKLARTQDRLLEQSYQSGMSEVAADILHNVKNSFSGITSGCEKINTLIRKSRTGNIRKAVKELLARNGKCSDPSYTELLEYIDLATETTEQQFEKIQVANKQIESTAYIINSILTDQHRYTQVTHPVQWCDLYEIFSETLPLLKPACRNKVEIEVDPFLKDSGEILTHRIVFIQIVTNILTNGIESIMRSGIDNGLLSISASVEKDSGSEMIHLVFKDNGEGIKPERFELLFKRGRSSKKDSEHSGLGLHWVANTLSGMGGRIYAESDGAGKGATFHLLVPRASSNETAAFEHA
ncbi:MAG: HAMP domain-containing histidine kinase [Proteobacteria bacterium]|nr:HAMP domain-containing histidine kinase [Pseudomonadota bacterium]MBU1739363.1 HAMP domain-containing histidine kinase [Pseudomonadota bacterium]